MAKENEKIRVIIKKPGQEPEVTEIGTELADYKAAVGGGFIEAIPFPGTEEIDIVVDEEGKLKDQPYNVIVPEYGDVLVGQILILGVDLDTCLWRSLTDDEIATVQAYIAKHAY